MQIRMISPICLLEEVKFLASLAYLKLRRRESDYWLISLFIRIFLSVR